MRFERLAIPAFGPFTDVALDFPSAGADFHLVYGPNEAGKSSLLRAIRDLLYGIHGQTPDDFLHDYKALRIAATLCRRDGKRLAFQRRKGNRNTLLDESGSPLPDDALAPFLGAVDREYFTTMFGLDASRLRNGAAALLQGQGDLGQALFSASLAGTPVHRILDALDAEARRLFDGRARVNVTIRPALDDYDEHLRASREATVKPETWDAAVDSLRNATAERDRLDGELKALRERADWVTRCLDALPTLGRLQEAEQRLAGLPPAPTVEAGYVEAAERALRELSAAEAMRDGARTRVERLEGQLSRLAPRQDVLDRAPAIEAAHQGLPMYRERREELPAAERQREAAQATLRAALERLGLSGDPATAETLRSTLADDLAVGAAADDLTAASAVLRDKDDAIARLEQELEREQARLVKLPQADLAVLRTALSETGAAAAAANALATYETALVAAAQAQTRQLGLLRGAPADPSAAYDLPVPLAATLRGFETRASELERGRDEASKQRDAAAASLREIAIQLERLQQRGAIPSFDALADARGWRDATWAQVLAAWRARTDGEPVDGLPLAQAYPRRVQAADAIADRLRDDAALVAEARELGLRRAEAEAVAADAAARLAQANAEQVAWQAEWTAAWQPCGIAPGTAAEMLEWRDLWVEFRARHEQWLEARDRLAAAQALVEAGVARLRPLLADTEARSLPALRELAERRVREADEAQGRRRAFAEKAAEIAADLEGLRAKRPALAAAVERAQAAWAAHCATIGAPTDTSPAAGLALLDARRQAVEQRDALVALEARARSLFEAIERYEGDVAAIGQALGLIPGSVEVRESLAWNLLQNVQADAAQRAQLARQLDEEHGQVVEAESAVARADAEVARLVALAGAANLEELRVVLHCLTEGAEVEAAVLAQRDALQGAARGEPLDAFIARVMAEDRDGLAVEAASLRERIDELAGQRDEQLKQVSHRESERQRLERADSDAAEHLQAAKHAAVRIRHDAARYLRLRLATHFLREQIEQFRRRNQGPLLRRAGEIFAAVTRGSFEGLGTGFGDDDTPVLVGIRQGVEVGVEGMSEGTCDQLYLALRLSAIEQQVAGHEPMPVILDDLLVTFDDDRASAVLPILHDLGTRTQVFLFTHHRHLVQLAKSALPEGAVHYHELSATTS